MAMRHNIALAALSLATPAAAQDYVLQLEYETETRGDDGVVTSSASGRQPIAERVIAASPEGTVLEYSLPFDPEEIRGNERWMFPARMRVSPDGTKTILNPDELLTRNAAWLAEAEWPREVCSRWGFSWTAFQVRCDVQAAIEAVETYGMQPGRLAEGQSFVLKGALGPMVLARSGEIEGRIVLTGTGPVDPAFVRERDARGALVVAEVSGERLTPEEATARAARITATGTLTVTLEVDGAGMVWRREDRSEITTKGSEYSDGTRRAVQTVSRIPRAVWDRMQAEQEAREQSEADVLIEPASRSELSGAAMPAPAGD